MDTENTQLEHICLIDDDEITDILVSGLLRRVLKKPFRFSSYREGQSALQGLEKLAHAAEFPDLILLDLKMPVMDGFVFLQHYARQYPVRFPQTRLAILTSSLISEEQAICEQYPFVSAYLVKPLLLTQLQNLLEGKP